MVSQDILRVDNEDRGDNDMLMFFKKIENDTPSFNPFEEPEVAPPAYNEIHRDSVVNLAP